MPWPAGRALQTAVYDPATNSMIVFGGNLSVGNCFNEANDLRVLANANGVGGTPTWAQITPAGAPPSIRDGHSAVYDRANNRMIVFGGRLECSNANAEIWVLANANGVGGTPAWTQLFPVAGPAPDAPSFHSAVYDPGSNRMIIFGGATSTNLLNDVWVLANANGLGGALTWTQLTPSAPLPPLSQGHSAIYDPVANTMTIFAGSTSIGIANDVWMLANANGLGGAPAWTQLQPAGGPPVPRSFHSAVVSLPTGRMTMFGGEDSAGFGLNDTWVLTGAKPQVSATTTVLSSSANPSVFGQSVTFTAAVSPVSGSGTPTGTVSFNDGAVTMGTGTLSGSQTSFTTSSLSVGSHSITAVYSGDSNFTASTSVALTQTVNKASTTTVAVKVTDWLRTEGFVEEVSHSVNFGVS